MNAESYDFKLGDFECIAISDGSFNYTPATFFANAPGEALEETLREHNLLVFAHHFPPFPNLGSVLKEGVGWQWQPIQVKRMGEIPQVAQ